MAGNEGDEGTEEGDGTHIPEKRFDMADGSTSRIMGSSASADAGRRRPTLEVETNVLRTM